MKVVTASEMARLEKRAYTAGASERAFMVNAGRGVAEIAHDYVKEHELEWAALLLCGKGNNAGDAYVAGSRLRQAGFTVRALQLAPLEKCSPLCREQAERFEKLGGEIVPLSSLKGLDWPRRGVVLDGLFGTGFRGEVEGLYRELIQLSNERGLPTIAIDIPSGVQGDTGDVAGVAIRADVTVYLGLPKMGLFTSEAWNHVGRLRHVDFGLKSEMVAVAESPLWLCTQEQAAGLLPPIVRSRHKYQAGYVVGVTGSPQMPGAAVLSGTAALRGGAGMVRLFHAPGFDLHHCGLPPEVIAEPYSEAIYPHLSKASALYIGPGIGMEMADELGRLLPQVEIPCLLDADALTLLAERGWSLPRQTVITPHRGEMERLLGMELGGGLDFLEQCERFVHEKQVVCVLKGGPTFLFEPSDLSPIVIQRGDPAMATAGSGDVLSGLVAALLAQGLAPIRAAALGVYLHGVAGEHAARRLTPYSVMASDITAELPTAFAQLEQARKQNLLAQFSAR